MSSSSHSVSTSTIATNEEDSDADILYSTEWDESSEDEGEEEVSVAHGSSVCENKCSYLLFSSALFHTACTHSFSQQKKEGPPNPPRSKTYYIAHEILTTERT